MLRGTHSLLRGLGGREGYGAITIIVIISWVPNWGEVLALRVVRGDGDGGGRVSTIGVRLVGEFIGVEKSGETVCMFTMAEIVYLILSTRRHAAVVEDLGEVFAVVANAALQHEVLLLKVHRPTGSFIDGTLRLSESSV